MNVPLVHRESAGLYLGDTQVCWVGLSARWGRLHRVRYAAEPGEERDVRAALKRLVERTGVAWPYVVTHLDPVHVRHALLEGPSFDDEEALGTWMRDQAARRLPTGGRLDSFVVRSEILDQSDDRTSCRLVVAAREAVDERRQLVTSVGLKPLGLGAVEADLGLALAYDPGFTEGLVAALLLQSSEAVLAEYREGRFQGSVPLPAGSDDLEALAREVEAVPLFAAPGPAGRPARLYVVGQAAEAATAWLKALPLDGCAVVEGRLLLPVGRKVVPLPASHAVAAGLAMRLLFPALGHVDLLDAADTASLFKEQERHEAIQVLLYAGGVVLALLLLAMGMMAALGSWQRDTEAELLRLADQVAEVEQARGALERLEREVIQAQRLVTERTHAALTLSQVGRAVPDYLWLETLRFTTAPEGVQHLALEGATFDEVSLALYLKRLEQERTVQEVRLVYSETASARRMYHEETVKDQPVVRFAIRLQVAGFPSDTTAAR